MKQADDDPEDYVLSTGRRISLIHQTIGLRISRDPGDFEGFSIGADDFIKTSAKWGSRERWSNAERMELAAFMADRWLQWAGVIAPVSASDGR
jgi:hypothetical protein